MSVIHFYVFGVAEVIDIYPDREPNKAIEFHEHRSYIIIRHHIHGHMSRGIVVPPRHLESRARNNLAVITQKFVIKSRAEVGRI